MSRCGACGEKVGVEGECVVCGMCKTSYHYECSIRETKWRNMSSEQRVKWVCSKCKGASSQPPLSRTNSTSSRVGDSDVEAVAEDDMTVKAMLKTIMADLNVLKDVRTKVEGMEESLNFHTKQYDELLREVKELRQENKNLVRQVTELQKENEKKDDQMRDLSRRFNSLEQYGRAVNMEINGLEQLPNEKVDDMLQKVSEQLQVSYSAADIQAAHRIPSYQRGRTNTLLVQFVNKKTKSVWLEAAKKKPLVSRNIVGSSGNKLYFGDNLTPYYKRLLREAKEVARNTNHRYVWVKNGRILVKFDDHPEGKVHHIVGYEDLENLK